MKIIRFELNGLAEFGAVKNNIVYPIINSIYANNIQINDTRPLPYNQIKLLPPILPSKIICVQGNYMHHLNEMDQPIPEIPQFFYKPVSAIVGTEAHIEIPENIEGEVHYEAELAFVIKKTPPKEYREKDFATYVLGYTIFNDVTARYYQERDENHFIGKSFDTFAAVGPCIETILNPTKTRIQLRLNNEVKQSGNTDDLLFPVSKLIHYLAEYITLLPGDLITTGTPSGVGPMKPGDLIEIDIEKIGCLRNYVR